MAPALASLPVDSLRRLHRGVILKSEDIVSLLNRAKRERIELHSGVNRKSEPRSARITRVDSTGLLLHAPNLKAVGQPQIYLHFSLNSTRYFFASPPIEGGGDTPLLICVPAAIYEAERRDLPRRRAPRGNQAPRVAVLDGGENSFEARLRDWSYQGMALAMPAGRANRLGDRFEVEILDGEYAGQRSFAAVRKRSTDDQQPGWMRIGVESSTVAHADPLNVERRERILEGGFAQRTWRRVSLATAVATRVRKSVLGANSQSSRLEIVSYPNLQGHEIRALVDRSGNGQNGTVVVIPPAWGRTKETFLPLARTLVSTFEREGESLSVLRFDGTNRRGESYIDPECRAAGDEYLHFRFSRAVDDIRASVEFAQAEFRPKRLILVTFSLGAIEGRRAIANENSGRIDGWVSVVGMVDLQSGLRTVSGGIDFAYGQSLGVDFGRHELVGVVADMDHTGRDAFEHEMVFLEDAKRDMAKIIQPISWIHGRYDGWMDLERVQALMSAGPKAQRRLIEVAAGHQMRSSREALETFQLISSEVSRMAVGREFDPALPDLVDLERRNSVERSRRPTPSLDRRQFWSDYLLGRDRRLGFELLSATSPYRALMNLQIDRLELRAGARVLDLGGGTGDFEVLLGERELPSDLAVIHVDLVPAALERARSRASRFAKSKFQIRYLAADLETGPARFLPFRKSQVDVVLASLVLSYVKDPQGLLSKISQVLRPGGRLVISSMRRDADISRIYVDSIAELPPDRRASHFGDESAEDFEELQRVFLNDAAKLIQLEEEGRFRFFDLEELRSMTLAAGLRPVYEDYAFGDPPQAVIVTAIKPI